MKIGAFILALLAGCSPLTPERKDEIAFNRAMWPVQYRLDAERCRAIDGIMVIVGPVDRNGIPKYRSRYECAVR